MMRKPGSDETNRYVAAAAAATEEEVAAPGGGGMDSATHARVEQAVDAGVALGDVAWAARNLC